jgi:four helix bundle protein
MKDNIVQRKSFEFALETIELYRQLVNEREYVLSKQLLRSGTSIGANIEEATAAQSRKDFVHKMTIASKEARETQYWIRLLIASNITKIDMSEALIRANELVKLLTAIVKSTSNESRPSH